MGSVPEPCVQVRYRGVANVRGETGNIVVALLKDEQERTMAVPLTSLEANLLEHTLDGNDEAPEPPQPYRTLLACFDKLGVELGVVRIDHTDEYDLPTHLILRPKSGQDVEVDVSCCDGILYAELARVPLFVSDELVSAIGARSPSEMT